MSEEICEKILSVIGNQQYFLTSGRLERFKSDKGEYRVYNVDEMSRVDADEAELTNESQDYTQNSTSSKVSR